MKIECQNNTEIQDDILDELMEDLLKKLEKQELHVINVANEAEKLYKNRYLDLMSCECATHTCSTAIEDLECHEKLRKYNYCSNYTKEYIDPDRSGVRLPPGTDPLNLNDNLKISICSFQNLGPILGEGMTLENDFWMAFGANTGFFIKWPLIPDARLEEGGELYLNDCEPYETRSRPWYNGAVSGPKEIVLMIDRSSSMRANWSLTIDAAFNIIDTFTHSDFVSVFLFSDEIKILLNGVSFLQASTDTIEELKNALDNEPPDEGSDSNFKIAFEKAFTLFEASNNIPKNITNAKNIFVITDGDTEEDSSDVLSLIETYQNTIFKLKNDTVIIHPLLIQTSRFNPSLPLQISCENNGLSIIISNNDILSDLTAILSFNALRRPGTAPVWIEPYKDFASGNLITTVTQPSFSENYWLIGITAKDLIVNDVIDDTYLTYDILREVLMQRSSAIATTIPVDPCGVQILRNQLLGICPAIISNKTEYNCFQFQNSYYKINNTITTWSEARSNCQQDGGDLVVLDSKSELEFIASLGHPDGTWIGAIYDINSTENMYQWIDEDMEDRYDFYGGWSVNEPPPYISGEQRCVAIDPRGISSNLFTEVCDKIVFNYICEFKIKPESCINGNQYIYNEMGNFDNNPPLEQCDVVEELNQETLFLDEINNIESEQAICAMGDSQINWHEIACCVNHNNYHHDDDQQYLEYWVIIIISIAIFLGVFILTFIVLLCLYHMHVIKVDPCFYCNKFLAWCCGAHMK